MLLLCALYIYLVRSMLYGLLLEIFIAGSLSFLSNKWAVFVLLYAVDPSPLFGFSCRYTVTLCSQHVTFNTW